MIDTHAHLDHLKDLDGALDRAFKVGVSAIVAVSEDLSSSKKNLVIKKQFRKPTIYCGAGIHPSEARIDDLEEFETFVRKSSADIDVIAETGLDFWYRHVRKDDEKKEEQIQVFCRMLALAQDLNKPIVVHSRGAWKQCLDIVQEVGIKSCEFHWYSGPIEVLKDILDAGFFISATPSLAYSLEAQEAIEYAPIEQTLIETDTPVYYRNRETKEGFSAEPANVLITFKLYCDLKKIDPSKAAETLDQNARNFFNL